MNSLNKSFRLLSTLLLTTLALSNTVKLLAAPIPVQSFKKDADGLTCILSPGRLKLTVCSDSIVRVMCSPRNNLPAGQDFVVTNRAWPKTSFKVADANGKVTLSTQKLKVAVDKVSGAVAFFDSVGNPLVSEPQNGG